MWKVGEEVLFIHGHPEFEKDHYLGVMQIGQRCKVIYTSSDPSWFCESHGAIGVVRVHTYPTVVYCPKCFAKPLDFSPLLQVTKEDTIKEYELVSVGVGVGVDIGGVSHG